MKAFEEERVDSGVARRQLRWMQIPSLVVRVHEGVTDVIDVQSPRAMHSGDVLVELRLREFVAAMRRDRHGVRRGRVGEAQ